MQCRRIEVCAYVHTVCFSPHWADLEEDEHSNDETTDKVMMQHAADGLASPASPASPVRQSANESERARAQAPGRGEGVGRPDRQKENERERKREREIERSKKRRRDRKGEKREREHRRKETQTRQRLLLLQLQLHDKNAHRSNAVSCGAREWRNSSGERA